MVIRRQVLLYGGDFHQGKRQAPPFRVLVGAGHPGKRLLQDQCIRACAMAHQAEAALDFSAGRCPGLELRLAQQPMDVLQAKSLQ